MGIFQPAVSVLGALMLCLPGIAAAHAAAEPPPPGLQALGQGAALLSQGRHYEACRRFRAAVDLEPEWAMARYELARCLRLIGDPHRQALLHIDRALASQPQRSSFRLERALILVDRGALDAALAIVAQEVPSPRAARERARDNSMHATTRGQLLRLRLQALRPQVTTIKALQDVTRERPYSLEIWRSLAAASERLGQLELAQHAWTSLAKKSRNPSRLWGALGAFGERTKHAESLKSAKARLAK